MVPSEAGDGGMALQIMAEDPATGQLVLDQCAALSRRMQQPRFRKGFGVLVGLLLMVAAVLIVMRL